MRFDRERVLGPTASATRMVALAVAVAAGGVGATAAYAAPGKDAGDAAIVAGPQTTRTLGGGGSATEFSLRLPQGASCPGDSANDGFRVQSFIVPAADDPGALRYRSIGPVGPGRYALYDVFTNPYVQAQTAQADAPGGPGRIVNLPSFSFEAFPPGELGEGPYRVGIACTLLNETLRYWDASLVLERTADDKPAGLRWKAPVVGGHKGRAVPRVATATLLGAAAAVAVLGLARRRSRRAVPTPSVDE